MISFGAGAALVACLIVIIGELQAINQQHIQKRKDSNGTN